MLSSITYPTLDSFPYRSCFDHTPLTVSLPSSMCTFPDSLVSEGDNLDNTIETKPRSASDETDADDKDEISNDDDEIIRNEENNTSPLQRLQETTTNDAESDSLSNMTTPSWTRNLLRNDDEFNPKTDEDTHSDSASEYEEKSTPPILRRSNRTRRPVRKLNLAT